MRGNELRCKGLLPDGQVCDVIIDTRTEMGKLGVCSEDHYKSLFVPQLKPIESKTADLLRLHKNLCRDARALMVRKNADYSAGDRDDPFKNFRGSIVFGVNSEIGVLIRMQDKFMRVKAFLENGQFAVQDEGIWDIGCDLINYSVLLVGLLKEHAVPIAPAIPSDVVAQMVNLEDKTSRERRDKIRRTSYPIPEGYRLLDPHEIIKSNDNYWDEFQQAFVPVPTTRMFAGEVGERDYPIIRAGIKSERMWAFNANDFTWFNEYIDRVLGPDTRPKDRDAIIQKIARAVYTHEPSLACTCTASEIDTNCPIHNEHGPYL